MEEVKNEVELMYRCRVCWAQKAMVYDNYQIAKMNKVYCDECITKKMDCVTRAYDELIATLD